MEKNGQAGLKLWPFSSQESTLTTEPSGQLPTKSTNKPHPFLKIMYYIMLLDALCLDYTPIYTCLLCNKVAAFYQRPLCRSLQCHVTVQPAARIHLPTKKVTQKQRLGAAAVAVV